MNELLGPFYTDQIPSANLVITIKDQTTDDAKSLTAYTGAELKMVGPDGVAIDTTGGNASILSAAAGTVAYVWPTTSLFSQPGDYMVQVHLTATGVRDITSPLTFEVKEAIG